MHVKCWKSKEGYMLTGTTYSRRHAGMVNTNIQPMITEQQGLTITRLCFCRSTANTGMIREILLLTAKLFGNFILRKIKIAYLLDGMINSYQSHMHVDIFENLTHMLLVLHWALSSCLWPLWDLFHAFKIKIMNTPRIIVPTFYTASCAKTCLSSTQKYSYHFDMTLHIAERIWTMRKEKKKYLCPKA